MESICIPCPDTTEQFKTESNENNTAIQSFKFICPKCGYGTNNRGHYNTHLNRKTDCTPLPSGTKRCSKCNQVKNKVEFYTGQGDCKICFLTSRKCEHGRDRSKCKVCGGGSICVHGRIRSQCKECGGSQVCEHGRERYYCKECGGAGICDHGRRRDQCPDCQGPVISKKICKICIKTRLSSNRIQLGICAKCDADASEIMRTEEIVREMIMKLVDFEPSLIDSSINGVSCQELQKRRPDFIYVLPNVVIVIEIDEDSHEQYESSCEMAKICQQNAAIQLCDGLDNVDVITIRLNPDAYHIGKVSRETRAEAVAKRVNKLIDEYHDKLYERTGYQRVEYYYYHKKAQHHIDAQGQISDVMVFPQT